MFYKSVLCVGGLALIESLACQAFGQVQPTAWELREPGTRPSARGGHALVYEADLGTVLLHGGNQLNETWRWDGDGWFKVQTGVGPWRTLVCMVHDSARRRTVLFGGDGVDDDTWEWDGSTWLRLTPAPRPQRRNLGAMAFDARRGKVVLFGGQGAFLWPETWTWDGSQWTMAAPTGPPPRSNLGLAYDASREVVVLFGGQDWTGLYNDLWEWDGSTWRQIVPFNAPPRPRAQHRMTYDTLRGRIIVVGGLVSVGNWVDETWEYDGETRLWSQVMSSVTPGRLYLEGIVYDERRSRTLLFGGVNVFTPEVLSDRTLTYQEINVTANPPQPVVGQATSLALASFGDPLATYLLAASFSRVPGIPTMDRRWVSLEPDSLFALSVGSVTSPFGSFRGTLDATGRAQASINIPPEPSLAGLRFLVSGVTVGMGGIRTVLTEVEVLVRP